MPLPPPPTSSQRARKHTPLFAEPEFNIMGSPVNAEGASTLGSGPVPPPARPSAAPRVRSRVTTPIPAGYEPPGASPAPNNTASQPIAPAPSAQPSIPPPVLPAAPPPRAPEIPADLPPPRKSRGYLWIAISLPLLLCAGIAGAWLARKPWMVVEAPPAREFLLRADEALAAHRPTRFEEAASEYTKALAFHEDDAHILSSLSRVYAVWSQMLRSRAEGMRARGEGSEVELMRLGAESERLAELAKVHGERAAQRNPGNVEAEVALSDALRLTGNSVAARAELDRARHAEPVPSADALRVAAWLAIDEAHGDMKAGKALAQQAVEQEPKLLRVRFLLVDCLIAERDFDGARMHLDAIRSIAPDHPLLLEVSRALDRASRPAPDAGVAQADGNAKSAAQPDAAAGKTEKPDDDERTDEDPGVIVNPDAAAELVKRGERALEDGAVRQAQSHFEEALSLAPNFPPALTGLGYVALERGQTQIALRRFLPAAKVGHGEALIGLGDTYRRVGRSEEALEAYKTYVRRFPRGSRRSIAQRQIELLREQLAGGGSP
jgi:tetratricopeptide (TPR) repeat protein